MIRECKVCKKNKDITLFPYRKDRDTFRYECFECRGSRLSSYRKANLPLLKEKAQHRYCTQKDIILLKKKQYYSLNKDKILLYKKNNRDKIALYQMSRKRTNIQYKLTVNLRDRLNKAIKNNQKVGSAVADLGCSIVKLKIYLQLKFHRNPRNKHEYMTWENYGKYGWHIDHIKPLNKFDLSDVEQLKQACHYTNLQPMWATDNLKKRDKYV